MFSLFESSKMLIMSRLEAFFATFNSLKRRGIKNEKEKQNENECYWNENNS
jgi:hypothetical protein